MGWGSKLKSAVGTASGKLFGGSTNQQLTNQTAQQSALTNNYLNAINGGAARSIGTLQGYADTAYNPYDAAEGAAVYGEQNNEVDRQRQNQLNAVKGGAMNRFSLGAQKGVSDINKNAMLEHNQLRQAQLGDETNANQQAYGNQMGALGSLTGLGAQMSGMNTFQNQTQVNDGWLGKTNKVISTAKNVRSILY